MSELRDWAKLDTQWYDDPDLLACADEHPAAFALWPVLVAKAKAASSAKTNPDGAVTIAPRKLADDARCSIDDLGPALECMQSEGLLTFTADGTKKVVLTLGGFAKWQSPRGSAADRKARSRAAQKVANSRESHTVSHDVTKCPIDVDGDVDGEETPTNPVGLRAHEGAPAREAASQPTDEVMVPVELIPTYKAACTITVADGERGMWAEHLSMHRTGHPGIPAEQYLDAMLRTKAWADSKLDGKFPFGKAWGSFLKDLGIVRRDDAGPVRQLRQQPPAPQWRTL